MRDDRVSLPKNENQLSDMNDEEDNVYMTSIHDRYAARPESLQNMCLATFAVSYEPIFGAKKTHDENVLEIQTKVMQNLMKKLVQEEERMKL